MGGGAEKNFEKKKFTPILTKKKKFTPIWKKKKSFTPILEKKKKFTQKYCLIYKRKNEKKKVQEKMNASKVKGVKVKTDKDW